jgi:HlyD family secretion protein
MRFRKRLLIIAAALGLAVLILLSFRPEAVPVSMAEVSRGALRVTVEEEGRTRVRERYVVSSPVAASMPRLELHAGDAVTRGQVLLRLQPAPAGVLDARSRAEAQARVSAARATLSAQQQRLKASAADHELARREYDRTKKLVEEGTLAGRLLDEASAALQRTAAERRSAQAAVDVARHDLEAARAILDYSGAGAGEEVAVTAPVDGRVLEVLQESQNIVTPGMGLIVIGDPGSLEIEVEVLSADAVRIRPGMTVWLHRWGGARPLEARVRMVEPAGYTKVSALGVEEQRVKVIADIITPFEQWQSLGDAYRVEAEFVLWESQDVLKLPTSALFRHGEGWAVYVVDGGRARRAPVRIGRQGGLESQVLEGVEAGQQVIVHPDNSLDDGVRVTTLKPA